MNEAIDVLLDRFAGRRDAYLLEVGIGRRERTFVRKTTLTEEVVAKHVDGIWRVGAFCDPKKGALYARFDMDGKHSALGRIGAWELTQKVAGIVDSMAKQEVALVELTRSGKGYAVYVLFDKEDMPTYGEALRYGQLICQLSGDVGDFNDKVGHVGFRPTMPGPGGYGTTGFMPLCGVNAYKSTGALLDSTGRRMEDQVRKLKEGVRLGRRQVLEQMGKAVAVLAGRYEGDWAGL